MENQIISPTNPPTNYASFGRRLGAFVIDFVLVSLAQSFVVVPLLAIAGISAAARVSPDDLEDLTDSEKLALFGSMAGAFGVAQVVNLLIGAAYFILMESSAKQATVGKLAMGIVVTDLNGGRITPVTALLRYVGRFVSAITLMVGYIMAAFTEKKQALHDIIASTLVLKP